MADQEQWRSIAGFCPCLVFSPPAGLLKVQNACFRNTWGRARRPAMLAVFLTCYLISEAETAAPGGPPTPRKWVTPCRSAAEKDASVRLFQTAIRHLRNPAHLSSRVVITHMRRIAGDDKEGLFSPSADSQSVFFLNDSRAEECFPFDRRQSAFCGREVTVTESRQQGAPEPTLGRQGRCCIHKVPFGFFLESVVFLSSPSPASPSTSSLHFYVSPREVRVFRTHQQRL